jgi:hypothetical protein
MLEIRAIRLPDRFYLSRRSYSGQEIFDVLPWEGAKEYVTDGERYGIRMYDGSVRWLEESRIERFKEDFAGVDLQALIDGLNEYTTRYRILRDIWKEDLDALQELRSRDTDPEPDP